MCSKSKRNIILELGYFHISSVAQILEHTWNVELVKTL